MGLWTSDPACDALLRTCINNRITLTQMRAVFAEQLGIDVTRNALVGRAFRLGLTVHRPPKPEPPPRRAKRLKPKSLPTAEAPAIAPAEILPVSLFDLRAEHCRFPNADASLYCGALKLPHSSYCAIHHRICYYAARSH